MNARMHSHTLTPQTIRFISLDYTTAELCLAIVHRDTISVSVKTEIGGKMFFKIHKNWSLYIRSSALNLPTLSIFDRS